MSSMLLKPIMRRPSQSIDEYRELTFVIGSPIVFQTAPPHPASKARITCSPQLVGGALASQNGFGHLIPPAKFVVKSAIRTSPPKTSDSPKVVIRHSRCHSERSEESPQKLSS